MGEDPTAQGAPRPTRLRSPPTPGPTLSLRWNIVRLAILSVASDVMPRTVTGVSHGDALTRAGVAWAGPPAASGSRDPEANRITHAATSPLNKLILAELRAMPNDGSLPYAWDRSRHTDGVSTPVAWRGELLAEPDGSGGVHCSGVTFEVWVRALDAGLGGRPGPTAEELRRLKQAWYNRGDSDGGPVDALVAAGLGMPIARLEDLQPGDLVQFWRNNGNGHSAVFVDHTRTRSGAIRGMVFWSAQSSSHGLGRRYVSVGRSTHQITPGRLYGVRPVVPASD